MITLTLTAPWPFLDFSQATLYPRGKGAVTDLPAGIYHLGRRVSPYLSAGDNTAWFFLAGTETGIPQSGLLDWASLGKPTVLLRERIWVLSLCQPWATLWAIGAKRIETRGWATVLRGEVGVHATAGTHPKLRQAAKELMQSDMVKMALADYGQDLFEAWGEPFPRGKVLGTTRILDCRSTDQPSSWDILGLQIPLPPDPSTPEFAYGDYRPERWMWLTENATPFRDPIPAKGHQKLWTWERDLVAAR